MLLVASGAELSAADVTAHAWTTERTASLGAVLQSLLHGYTEGAITVTTNLVTLISRFALQVRAATRCRASLKLSRLDMLEASMALSWTILTCRTLLRQFLAYDAVVGRL